MLNGGGEDGCVQGRGEGLSQASSGGPWDLEVRDSRPSVLGSDSLAPPSTTKRPRG